MLASLLNDLCRDQLRCAHLGWRGLGLYRRIQGIPGSVEAHQDIPLPLREDNQRPPAVRLLGRDPNRFVRDCAGGNEGEAVFLRAKYEHVTAARPAPISAQQEDDRVSATVAVEVGQRVAKRREFVVTLLLNISLNRCTKARWCSLRFNGLREQVRIEQHPQRTHPSHSKLLFCLIKLISIAAT